MTERFFLDGVSYEVRLTAPGAIRFIPVRKAACAPRKTQRKSKSVLRSDLVLPFYDRYLKRRQANAAGAFKNRR